MERFPFSSSVGESKEEHVGMPTTTPLGEKASFRDLSHFAKKFRITLHYDDLVERVRYIGVKD